jgi:hypothetical protein
VPVFMVELVVIVELRSRVPSGTKGRGVPS